MDSFTLLFDLLDFLESKIINGYKKSIVFLERKRCNEHVPTFSGIVQQQQAESRQQSIKRKLVNSPASQSRPKNLPPQQRGTRENVTAFKVAPAPAPKPVKPKFDRAIHLSNVENVTTTEMITSYVADTFSLKPNEEFRCTMLVKKGTDVSTLSFVSFKVDFFNDSFDRLMNAGSWPNGSLIREFVPQERPKIELGSFIQPNKVSKTNEKNDLSHVINGGANSQETSN